MVTKEVLQKPTLLLADDHAIVVDGLRRLLQDEYELIGTAGDGWALLKATRQLKPDVIVLDISMPLLNGIDAVRHLNKGLMHSKVLFLSMHADVEIATEALMAGASGYVLKHSASEALSYAIREVLAGRIFVSPRISRDVIKNLLERSSRTQALTNRLTQENAKYFNWWRKDEPSRGLRQYCISGDRTVVFHKSNIMDKLGLRTTADLTQHAIKSGMISLHLNTPDAPAVEAQAS